MESEVFDTGINYLVTGAAGFIGSSLSKRLLEAGCRVLGLDNMNDYYDVELKISRLELLKKSADFTFIKGDISDYETVRKLFEDYRPQVVIHLAAQAGVRYSITNPKVYIESNIVGFFHILEACRQYPLKHLLYASSSSVYGANQKVPFEETDSVESPKSLYAATKKSNELMAYSYSSLYGIPATGLRFFTVYGPMGRPDMAYYSFTNQFFKNESIHIFNQGTEGQELYRDFTYIDDITRAIISLIHYPPQGEVRSSIYNIGNSNPQNLMSFIRALERALSHSLGSEVEFKKSFETMKKGDVPATYASTDRLHKLTGFKPSTSMEEGLLKFTDWYVDYYKVKKGRVYYYEDSSCYAD